MNQMQTNTIKTGVIESPVPRFLTEVPVGVEARVIAVNGDSSVTRRLMEMGVIPGVVLRVIKAAPFGDPIEVRVRGYSLAMRKNEASAIEVTF